MKTGFIGLGVMGEPMARNLARAGTELIVWNRTREKCLALQELGATVADTPEEVFATAETVIVMLADEHAIDSVLMRGKPGFRSLVGGHTIVNMGTTSPVYSRALDADVRAAGGHFVEAPVSGSRGPAESGQLVGLIAGTSSQVVNVRSLIAPMCARTFECGAVPNALLMKLSVNLFLITMVTGLAEAMNFAGRHRLDLTLLRDVLDAGPMASDVSRAKSAKLVQKEFSVQASIVNVAMNCRLITQSARESGIAAPLIAVADELFAQTVSLGFGGADMAAVIHALSARDARAPREERAAAPV